MTLDHLILEHYRNISLGELVFFPGINVLCGENAAGKTNTLEAIYLFAAGKSFRTNEESEFIQRGMKNTYCNIGFFREGTPDRTEHMQLRFVREPKRAKRLQKYEGIDIKKASEFLGLFRAVLFTPDHLTLVKGAPEERRRFLDIALSQLKPRYVKCLNEYARVHAQRNAFLKAAQERGTYDTDLLEVLNRSLARTAAIVTRQRFLFSMRLSEYASDAYRGITGGKDSLNVRYINSAKSKDGNEDDAANQLYALYCAGTPNEIRVGKTLYGPHRDDLLFYIQGDRQSQLKSDEPAQETDSKETAPYETLARAYGSQGEQRSVVLALKLAEGEIFREVTGEYPVFLLDDLFSELDEGRRRYLLQALAGKQAIITCCDPSLFAGEQYHLIQVTDGRFD